MQDGIPIFARTLNLAHKPMCALQSPVVIEARAW